MSYLSQQQAAAVADVTDRRLRQMDHEDDPPPRDGARYPCAAFGRWLDRREFRKSGRHLLSAFDAGLARGSAAVAWQVVGELLALAGAEPVADLWPPHRRPAIADLRKRLLALPNHEEVAGLLKAYADSLADAETWL